MKKHRRHETDCLNCGTELNGHFCHACGQENLHIKEPFWHFLGHSISHYFHFDEKFFTTLKPLLTQPGFLTQQYLDGKRTRFLHPISMYIFVSIIYFLVVPNLEHHSKYNTNIGPVHIQNNDDDDNVKPGAADSLEKAKMAMKSIHMGSKADSIVKKSFEKGQAKIRLKEKKARFKNYTFLMQDHVLDSLKEVNKIHPSDSLEELIDSFHDIHVTREDSTYEAYQNRQKRLPEDERDNAFERFSERKDIMIRERAKADKDWSITKEIEHYQPKLYFILMPMFAFCLMINFRRNHRYYVEHIVFTIHFFTAFFIFEIFVQPINYLVFHDKSEIFGLLMYGAIGWYCYTALRVFYQRPPWLTIRKMCTLGMMYLLAFGMAYGIIFSVVYLSL